MANWRSLGHVHAYRAAQLAAKLGRMIVRVVHKDANRVRTDLIATLVTCAFVVVVGGGGGTSGVVVSEVYDVEAEDARETRAVASTTAQKVERSCLARHVDRSVAFVHAEERRLASLLLLLLAYARVLQPRRARRHELRRRVYELVLVDERGHVGADEAAPQQSVAHRTDAGHVVGVVFVVVVAGGGVAWCRKVDVSPLASYHNVVHGRVAARVGEQSLRRRAGSSHT